MFVRDMSLRGLVSLGPPSEATVGVFVVPKKLGKQNLFFGTRRVNQRFRRPWHCVLPTLASWAGLQLPFDSTYHMAQTDVNTAFYRILPACQNISFCPVCPLNCTFVKVLMFQIICVTCPTCHCNFRSSQWVFLGLFIFCQKMVESCVQLAGFSADALLMDRHQAPAMTRDSVCFGVY